jgi:hypothetical protein
MGMTTAFPKQGVVADFGINAETIRRARMMGGEIYDPAEVTAGGVNYVIRSSWTLRARNENLGA